MTSVQTLVQSRDVTVSSWSEAGAGRDGPADSDTTVDGCEVLGPPSVLVVEGPSAGLSS